MARGGIRLAAYNPERQEEPLELKNDISSGRYLCRREWDLVFLVDVGVWEG